MAKTKTNQLHRVDIRGMDIDDNSKAVQISIDNYSCYVNLKTTPCHYGKVRYWFECPYCCGRAAVLYLGCSGLACQKCYALAYPIENKSKAHRAVESGFKVRKRLKWKDGCIGDIGTGKPKGMHWSTYQKLMVRHSKYAKLYWGSIGQYC
jgi:hypothetical protein